MVKAIDWTVSVASRLAKTYLSHPSYPNDKERLCVCLSTRLLRWKIEKLVDRCGKNVFRAERRPKGAHRRVGSKIPAWHRQFAGITEESFTIMVLLIFNEARWVRLLKALICFHFVTCITYTLWNKIIRILQQFCISIFYACEIWALRRDEFGKMLAKKHWKIGLL